MTARFAIRYAHNGDVSIACMESSYWHRQQAYTG